MMHAIEQQRGPTSDLLHLADDARRDVDPLFLFFFFLSVSVSFDISIVRAILPRINSVESSKLSLRRNSKIFQAYVIRLEFKFFKIDKFLELRKKTFSV